MVLITNEMLARIQINQNNKKYGVIINIHTA